MAAPKLLRNRKKRIWITVTLIALMLGLSIYFILKEPTSIVEFLNQFFAPNISKNIPAIVPAIVAVLIGVLSNLLSTDVSDSLKDEKDGTPEKIPVEITLKHEYKPPDETQPKIIDSNQKFYPNYFLPELKFFVGRTEVLQKIKETLATGHRAAIHDISGLGKTFTTYKFADDNKNNYDKIFFIRATKEEMMESLAKCGEMVNTQLADVEEQKAKALGFKQWLEENENWLVIYDNVDLPAELFPFVPVNKSGDCVFTSNFREAEHLGTIVDVKKLSNEDAGILLYSRANNKPDSLPDLAGEEKEAFDNLVKEIDGLPLTLNSTGAFVFNKNWTFAKFWQRYEKTPEIAWESEDEYSTYQRRSAGIVFSLAYEELCGADKVGGAVKTLLNAVSFISPDEIPEELLRKILQDQYESLSQMGDAENFWDEVREKLTGYDLLKYDRNKTIFITHRSIQRVIQTKLNNDEKKMVCRELCETLSNLFPNYDYEDEKRKACERYFQHAQTLVENADKLDFETEKTNVLYYLLGRYQKLLGNFAYAERFFLRAIDISANIFGKEHSSYAIDLNNLAAVCEDQARYDEAIEKYEEAQIIHEKTIGKEHPDYASSLSNLGEVYRKLNRHDEAIAKYEEALGIDEKTNGKERPDHAVRLNNLALAYKAQGRYDEAIEKYKEALQVIEKLLGNEHLYYALFLNNLAGVYEAQEKYKEALVLYEEALRIEEKILPDNHPYNALFRGNVESCKSKL